LGEGASGTILEGRWRKGGGQTRAVAVKLFKAAMTSDGLPRSEAFAASIVGEHRHLVAVHGRVVGHPQGREGLVLSRIPTDFRNLAGPPSFESCTRDVFEENLRMDAVVAVRVAESMASALAHIHARGLLHGDVYAHNVLVDAQGHALLGDFGAASPLPPAGSALWHALTALDRRALAILSAELTALVDGSAGELPGKPETR
jgi:serine/threonine protein kinase